MNPKVNFMCAEQTFAWQSRYRRILSSMTKTHHLFTLHRLVLHRNAYTELCLNIGRKILFQYTLLRINYIMFRKEFLDYRSRVAIVLFCNFSIPRILFNSIVVSSNYDSQGTSCFVGCSWNNAYFSGTVAVMNM